MINEDKMIASLQQCSEGFVGEDAATLPSNSDKHFVITKDLLIEDIYFRTDYFKPEDLAHKALHVNLSDIAAMRASPLYILCGISIPSNLHDYTKTFIDSVASACQEAHVILIGGDTTASQDALFISITAMGIASEPNIKYRNGASAGDLICVAGNIGFAHIGFLSIEQSQSAKQQYINSFLRPEAKIKEGIWLGYQPIFSSMMDISDGLYIDLKRLASSSKKHAVLDIDLLQNHLTPEVSIQIALEGGEDDGLLVTIPKDSLEELSHRFMNSFGYYLKFIGYITDGEGISFKQGKRAAEVTVNHFAHFGER